MQIAMKLYLSSDVQDNNNTDIQLQVMYQIQINNDLMFSYKCQKQNEVLLSLSFVLYLTLSS